MSSDIFRPENNSKCFKIKLIAQKFLLTEFIGTPFDGIKIFRDNPIIKKGNAEKLYPICKIERTMKEIIIFLIIYINYSNFFCHN